MSNIPQTTFTATVPSAWPPLSENNPTNNYNNNDSTVQFDMSSLEMCPTPCDPFFPGLMSPNCLLSSADSESPFTMHRDLSTVSLTQDLTLCVDDEHESMLVDLHTDTADGDKDEGTAAFDASSELLGGFVCPFMQIARDGERENVRRDGPCDDCPLSRKFNI